VNKQRELKWLFWGVFSLAAGSVMAQSGTVKANKGGLDYVVTTGVPFMRIAPDARSSGMAEVGVSTSADNYSGFHNPAKLAFMENDMGASASFAPWLRQITNDIYLMNVNGYAKIAPDHTAGLGIRYFTLGQINYTDAQNQPLGMSKPFEMTAEGHYAFRLAEAFSIGASGRFIYSNLSNGASTSNVQIPAGTAFSVDIAAFYSKKIELRGVEEARLNIGMNISNVGSKIQYLTLGEQDFIPTNLALGTTYFVKFDKFNAVSATLQFDKLLVPSPTYTTDANGIVRLTDNNRDSIADFKQQSGIAGIVKSFTDHGEGMSGEMREVIVHGGLEYSYDNTYFVRGGYFYEPESAGGRNYVTLGMGIKYNTLKLDFSYLLPITQQRSPLDNQMRISIAVNVGDKKMKNSNYW
jgi:hypothetical protein